MLHLMSQVLLECIAIFHQVFKCNLSSDQIEVESFSCLHRGFLSKCWMFRGRSHVSLMERLLATKAWILGKRQEFLIPCFLWAWPGLADILRFASSFRNCKAFFLLQRWQTLMWSLAVALLTSVIFSLWAVHGQAVPLLNLLSATAKINENEAIANLFFHTSRTRHCLLFLFVRRFWTLSARWQVQC